MTPNSHRSGSSVEAIRFTLRETWLGSILVGFSPQGVCYVALGDDPHALVSPMLRRYPGAQRLDGDRELEKLVACVVGRVSRLDGASGLPLDVQGTAFQTGVWRSLCEIPRGSTASYRVIAERMGQPKSARAVAKACASNSIAVLIPCHRVVRSDGSPSGYRWGAERKRTMLECEALHLMIPSVA